MSGFSFTDLQKVASSAGFDLVPDGTYEALIDTGAKTKKSGNGKDMIAVAFKIQSGPQAGKGRVFHNFVISPDSPNALAFFFRHMKVLGLDDKYFATNPPLDQVAKDLEGKSCTIEVGHREWNGTDRNEVKTIKKSAGGNAAVAPSVNGVPRIGNGISGTPGAASAPQGSQAQVSTPQDMTAQAAPQAATVPAPDDPFAG